MPLGAPGLVGLLALACAPSPTPVEVVDLVEDFRYAEIATEQPLIDLGTPSAAASLAGGWSWNETDPAGNTFVWAVGPRSGIRVYLASARDLEVRMRCRAFRYPGAPPQRLAVLWDDEEVGDLELSARFAEHRFSVPARLATAGDHRVDFVPTRFGRPAGAAASGTSPRHPRKLSFACDRIDLGAGPTPGEARGEADTLWIPAASEVAFYLEPEQDLELRWQGLAPRGGSGLEVVWEVEGSAPASTVVAGDSEPAVSLALPADRAGALPARLTLRAQAGRSGEAADGGGAVSRPPRPAARPLEAPPGGLEERATLPTEVRRLASSPGGEDGLDEAGIVLRAPRLVAWMRPSTGTEQEASGAVVEGTAAATGAAPSPGDGPPPESILLWIVDTLRVDRLGLYGHDRPVSPHLDALAERSTVFERAVAQSSWTRPTVATLLTGVGPERHGIRELKHGLDDAFVTLPERLRELGYATAGFSANANVTADTGFEQGFDRFEYGAVDVDTLAEWALDWLDDIAAETPDRPFFLMILSVEPHAAFDPAEPFRERFAPDVRDRGLGTVEHMRALSDRRVPSSPEVVDQLFQLYDAEIAWSDHVFGEFQRALDQRDRTPTVVFIADHGEAFEERGVFGHAWDLHREVLDVPFLIHRSGQGEGRRVSLPVQQSDLPPTLIAIAGGEAGPEIEGDSLLPLLGPGPAATPGQAEGFADRLILSTMDTFKRPAASLVRGRYKLIEVRRPGQAPGRQLFDRTTDPEELRDLAEERPLLAGRLARLLHEQLDLSQSGGNPAPEVELDEETRRRLQALGYIE